MTTFQKLSNLALPFLANIYQQFEPLPPEKLKIKLGKRMASKKTILVEGTEINVIQDSDKDFLSLTDIAKQSSDEPRFVIRNWMSTQNTITYLGAWESLNNPDFNRAGFRTFRDDFFDKPFSLTPTRWIELTNATEADLLNLALFGLTAKQWRETNPDLRGNIRDHASTEQLLILANLENLNAEFIKQGLSKEARLERLNEIAIYQMQLLLNAPVLRQLTSGMA